MMVAVNDALVGRLLPSLTPGVSTYRADQLFGTTAVVLALWMRRAQDRHGVAFMLADAITSLASLMLSYRMIASCNTSVPP